MRIDYFFSLISPYTYLAGDRLERIAEAAGAEIAYRPVDTLAVFAATGGVPVAQRHPSRQAYRLQDLRRQAEAAGVPLTLSPKFYPAKTGPASCAVIALAEAGGDAGALARAFLRAVWAEDRDIADPATVAALLAAHAGGRAIGDDAFDAAGARLAANTEAAIAAGVFGVPFYVVGAETFWGQDRLPDLARHIGA